MKARAFMTKTRLKRYSTDEPMRLPPGKAAVWCDRNCGNYLVVPMIDLDRFAAKWICPACEDDDRADHFTQLESQRPDSKEPC